MLGYSLVLASQDLTVLQGFYLSTDAYLQYLNLYPDSQTSPIYFIRFTYFPKMFAFCLSSAVAVTLIWNWNLLFKYGKLLLLPSNINLDSLSFYLRSIVGMHFLNIQRSKPALRDQDKWSQISHFAFHLGLNSFVQFETENFFMLLMNFLVK